MSDTGRGLSPRVRGTRSGRRCQRSHQGLSPRVRGNHVENNASLMRDRSIPACAGEPARRSEQWRSMGVYPRVCGGTANGVFRGMKSSGLSPRVRGNRRRRAADHRRAGSIPACAGEPPPVMALLKMRTVYPRVCGGTRQQMVHDHALEGLSPRVRGNPSADGT